MPRAPELAGAWVNGTLNPCDVLTPSGTGFSSEVNSAKVGGCRSSVVAGVTTDKRYSVALYVAAASRAFTFRLTNGVTGASGSRSNAITIPATAVPIVVTGILIPTDNGDWYPQINNGGAFAGTMTLTSFSLKQRSH